MNRTNESSLIRSLLGIPISDVVAEDADKRTPEPDPIEESAIRRLNTVAELPDDPVVPALMEIRAAWLLCRDRLDRLSLEVIDKQLVGLFVRADDEAQGSVRRMEPNAHVHMSSWSWESRAEPSAGERPGHSGADSHCEE